MQAIRSSSKSKDIVVATRVSVERHPETGTMCEFHFRMVCRPDRKFYLVEVPQEPGGREVVAPYSHKQVLAWLKFHPSLGRRATTARRGYYARLLASLAKSNGRG